MVEVMELGAWPVPLDLDDHILLVLLHLIPGACRAACFPRLLNVGYSIEAAVPGVGLGKPSFKK